MGRPRKKIETLVHNPAKVVEPPEAEKVKTWAKYRPEYCRKLVEYFNKPAYREVPEVWYHNDGSIKRESTRLLPNPPPYISGFCREVGIDKKSFYNWTTKYPDFARAVEIAQGLRKETVLSNGLMNLYNPLVVKLFAGHYFAMYDRQDVRLQAEVTSVLVKYYKPERGEPSDAKNHGNQLVRPHLQALMNPPADTGVSVEITQSPLPS